MPAGSRLAATLCWLRDTTIGLAIGAALAAASFWLLLRATGMVADHLDP